MSDCFGTRGSPVLIGEPKKQRTSLVLATDHFDIHQLITLVAVRQSEICPSAPKGHAQQKQQYNLHPNPTFAQHEFTLKNFYFLFIALRPQRIPRHTPRIMNILLTTQVKTQKKYKPQIDCRSITMQH